eukprot:6211321-Pleurochrysis_carterae.AAC.1
MHDTQLQRQVGSGSSAKQKRCRTSTPTLLHGLGQEQQARRHNMLAAILSRRADSGHEGGQHYHEEVEEEERNAFRS